MFFTRAGSELKVDLGYQWDGEEGALSLAASMEQNRFGDSRTTPWCKEDARDIPKGIPHQDSSTVWICPNLHGDPRL